MNINSNFTKSGMKDAVILGGGLAGLSAAHTLSVAGKDLIVIESDATVGGLSKTIIHNDFRFDLGGHRFITKNKKIEQYVKGLLDQESLAVSRKSKIYMRGMFFDYPLKPSNSIFGLGIPTTAKILFDYIKEKVKGIFITPVNISLEDWVVNNFGRTMFNLYFKDYSEKVWGIDCSRISEEWVSQRIRGLSLWVAIKNAFFKFSGKDVPTLASNFIYPSHGIGYLSDRLKEEIEKSNSVMTGTKVTQIIHKDFTVISAIAKNCDNIHEIEAREFVSSIPVTSLVQMLSPAPPDDVLEAASSLKYRDLVLVTVMVDREKLTDLTWIYIPEKDFSLGRIHEPKNWSPEMAPEGKTHFVCEYFCFEGDDIWNTDDKELTSITVKQLVRLGFIQESEVIDSCVVRVPKTYPLFEVGYEKHYKKLIDYLDNFKNLHITGRNGKFRYYNMDHTMESGIDVAERMIGKAL
ncbi:MAG: FAD-dependent oxidoreductase [Thermodesulfovibrionia bacterium]|nr:FAD-dependent oxidoreductase [Thermodesulfovibrionia bacterium]